MNAQMVPPWSTTAAASEVMTPPRRVQTPPAPGLVTNSAESRPRANTQAVPESSTVTEGSEVSVPPREVSDALQVPAVSVDS